MRIAVFSTKKYDQRYLESANKGRHQLAFFDANLTVDTAALAQGFDGVCVFVNDIVAAPVVEALHQAGVRCIALRCAGFNNVDLEACAARRIPVVRVPKYSPYAVAEHAAALLLTINRKTHRAFNRVREGNFAIDGLLGFDLHGKTIGIVGTGAIGEVMARISIGFGMNVLAYDLYPSESVRALAVDYVDLPELITRSDIISLHCPLTPSTHHLVDAEFIRATKPGVALINTSRGGLVDTSALIDGLKSGQIGAVGLDVYEEEEHLFFEDHSSSIITDDVFSRLLTFPNVVVTAHQAFFTHEALTKISQVTIANVTAFEAGEPLENAVTR